MSKRPLKYQEYLSKYNNCPSSDCIEKDKIFYRWVHKSPTDKDFYPTNCHPDIAPRIFDDSDVACLSYGLSVYETLDVARTRYIHEYNKRLRIDQKEKFILSKGDSIAELNIEKEDGLQCEPNIYQHITFYQYEGCPFLDRINDIFDTFITDEPDETI